MSDKEHKQWEAITFLRSTPGIFTLIHDTNGGIGRVKNYVYLVRKVLPEMSDDVKKYLERIIESVTSIQDAIDIYYQLLKKNYEEKITNH